MNDIIFLINHKVLLNNFIEYWYLTYIPHYFYELNDMYIMYMYNVHIYTYLILMFTFE